MVATGGGSNIIESAFVQGEKCDTMFNISHRYRFALKLCSPMFLDQISCRDLYTEIVSTLRYSLLFANRVCDNFVHCIGYGVNCCLLVSPLELATAVTPKQLRNASIMRALKYDIAEYLEIMEDEGCDTFILINLLSGPDLTSYSRQFDDRMTFELVYSTLCSVHFLGALPGDRHLDNYMMNKTKKGLFIQINGKSLHFPTKNSLVHIDYQVMSDRNAVRWRDIALVAPFIPPRYVAVLKKLINSNRSTVDKIESLPDIFDRFLVRDKPKGSFTELNFQRNQTFSELK